MSLHPSVHLELARQRHRELLAAAERHRIATASADRKAVRGLRAGRPSDSRLGESWAAKPSGGGMAHAVEVSHALAAADHFGHRQTDDIVVDLFWSRRVREEFRVVVEDRREHVRFVLRPTTGAGAIQAFYHPFAVARPALEKLA